MLLTETPSWPNLAQRANALSGSIIRELSKAVAANPAIISFAGGMPSPATFPLDLIRGAAERILATQAARSLQYAPTAGFDGLREHIARSLSSHGTVIAPERIFITNGSQQGLDIVGRLLIDAGTRVAVELPTYVGALQAFNPYGPSYIPLPCDNEGLLPDALRRADRAALLYTIPTFQNPSGRTLSPERRSALVQNAAAAGTLIVEDDPYGAIDFQGRTHRSLLSMNPDGVIHLGTFSKILAPGLRIGYAAVPEWISTKFEQAKQACDLHSSMLDQMIVHDVVTSGAFDAHLDGVREYYCGQCALLTAKLGEHFGTSARWTQPEGGMFAWLTFNNDRIDTMHLLDAALMRDVAFVPGAPFYAGQSAEANRHHLRLSYATVGPVQISDGVARLADAFRHYQDQIT